MNTEEKLIKLSDGTEIYSKIKESGAPIWIVATHGIGEHLGRHQFLRDLFGQDFNIFQYDLKGHGKSQGERHHIEDFYEFMNDLEELIQFLKDEYKMERYILFGHSMGALITAGYLQSNARKDFYPEKVFLSSPPVGIGGPLGKIANYLPSPLVNKLCKIPLSLDLPGMIDLDHLSHDPRVHESYEMDPLNATKLSSKLVLELARAQKEVFSRPLRADCDAYVAVGTADQIVCPQLLIKYFSTIEKSFALKIFKKARHEIHNEIKRYRTPYLEYLRACLTE
jgi:alpha-beta hydrolase superfamily lysophospholipase